MDNSKSTYTREEVAKLLKISEKTVYSYALEGKIEAAPNPYNVRRETVYTKESVDKYLKEIQELMKLDGYTLQEAAKELGISRQRINKIIQEHNIQVIRNSRVRGGAPKTIIPKESFGELKDVVQSLKSKTHKQAKSNFYSAELDIALFQSFRDSNGEIYRVSKVNGEWGFSKTSDNTFIPYEAAKQLLNLESVYSIHQKANHQLGYAKFTLPNNNETLTIIDYFLENLGVENIIIDFEGQLIVLYVRESILSIDEAAPITDTLESLKNHLVEGELILNKYELFIIAGQRRISAVISLNNYNQLTKLSKEQSKDLSWTLDDLLTDYFKKVET